MNWSFKQKNRKENVNTYNSNEQIPVLKSSICNGEKVAGFKDKKTGKFCEITCIKNDADLVNFLSEYNIPQKDLKKEW